MVCTPLFNKLLHLAAFREMDTPARRQRIKDNLAAVGSAYVPPDEARETTGAGPN